MALVDAVITTYGRTPEVLGRALRSVQGQTIADICIYVVDDNGSTSDIRHAIQDFMGSVCQADARVTYYQNLENSGACVARNNGFLAGSSPYVAFLDDDDEWLPTKLEKELVPMSNPAVGLVSCGYTVLFEKTGKTKQQLPTLMEPTFEDLLSKGNIPGSTSLPLVRREVLATVGMFDPVLKSAQDYDAWIRVGKIAQMRMLDEALLVYHVHSDERISANPSKKYESLQRIYDKNKSEIEAFPPAEGLFHRQLARHAGLAGNTVIAFKHLVHAIRVWPKDMFGYIKCLFIIIFRRGAWV